MYYLQFYRISKGYVIWKDCEDGDGIVEVFQILKQPARVTTSPCELEDLNIIASDYSLEKLIAVAALEVL